MSLVITNPSIARATITPAKAKLTTKTKDAIYAALADLTATCSLVRMTN
ncbi:MAG: hypothetical protein COB27_005900 [Moritella sp.]|nr:hypothetical protein [Moritella sp.]MBL1416389.1 hypothetical protein [Moritella sp.]